MSRQNEGIYSTNEYNSSSSRGDIASVIALCILLCGVYFLSLTLGDAYGEQIGKDERTEAAVAAINSFVRENEAISAFLGIEEIYTEKDGAVEAGKDAEREAAISEKVNEYIEKHNPLFEA